jgi:hypothetical protein
LGSTSYIQMGSAEQNRRNVECMKLTPNRHRSVGTRCPASTDLPAAGGLFPPNLAFGSAIVSIALQTALTGCI